MKPCQLTIFTLHFHEYARSHVLAQLPLIRNYSTRYGGSKAYPPALRVKSNYGQSCSKRNLDMNIVFKSSHFTLKTTLRDLFLSSYLLFKNDFKVAENISASNLQNEPFGP